MSDFSLPTPVANQANVLPHSVMTLPFALGFAGRWAPCADGKLRPVLVPFQLRPGLHSIGELSKDLRAQFGKLRQSAERRGYTIIEPGDGPPELGGPVHSFDAWEPERKAPVVAWKVKWETPKVGPNNLGRVTIDFAKLDAFLAHWTAKGLLPATPDESFIERALHDADRKHSTKLEKDPTGKGYSVRKAAADLKLWQAIADAHTGTGDVTPPPAAPAPTAPAPASPAKSKAKVKAGTSLTLDGPAITSEEPSGME